MNKRKQSLAKKHKYTCPFCEESRCKEFDPYDSNSDIAMVFDELGVKSRVIWHNKYFFLVPTLGCFVEGYTLLCTKEHYMSFHDFCLEHGSSVLEETIQAIRAMYSETYGEVHLFEHGSGVDSCISNGCLTHAHIHIVPSGSRDVCETMLVEGFTEENSWNWVRQQTTDYLLLNDGICNYVLNDGIMGSQYFRKRYAIIHELPRMWDWRKYFFIENMLRTLEVLRKQVCLMKEFYHNWTSYKKEIETSRENILIPEILKLLVLYKPQLIIDLGSGDGELFSKVDPLGKINVLGFEVNNLLVNVANEMSPVNHTYKQMNIGNEELCIESGKHDFVFSNCMIMHLSNRELNNMFVDVARCLSERGVAIFIHPKLSWILEMRNPVRVSSDIYKLNRDMNGLDVTEYYRTSEFIISAAKKSGLKQHELKSVKIPCLQTLSSRYMSNVGRELFEIIVFSK
ncbi:methyltransferase domain-containing protein [Vibrio parahaemolyticus]